MKEVTKGRNARIYFDHAATTPIDKRVLKAMKNADNFAWANPSSLHAEGEKAKEAFDNAKIEVAKILHCKKSEIYFTSGGTEALNIAIQGVVERSIERFKDLKIEKLPHIICSTIEHPAVIEVIRALLRRCKVEVSFVSPDEEGLINPESVARELKENTVLVCVMHTNNEIGTLQPIRKICSAIKSQNTKYLPHNTYLLVDASQSACYEDVSIERLGADILILDGIKMYGPRGVGVLVVRNSVEVDPIFYGGGQQNGLRSGTENVIGAIGFAEAFRLASNMREKESERLMKIRDYCIDKILSTFPNSSLNGSKEARLPNNVNICFASPESQENGFIGFDSEFVVIKLDTLGFAVSAASACHSLSFENGSYVIEALGKPECSTSSLRFTFGRDTKKTDIDKLIVALKKVLK